MSVCTAITLAEAKRFQGDVGEVRGEMGRGGVNVHIQQINCEQGLRKQNGGGVMNITSLDLSVFTGRP